MISALAAAFLAVAAPSAAPPPAGPRPAGVPELTDAQLAGQRVVFPLPAGPPPAALVARIRRGEAAGVILFARNIPSVAAARRTVAALQAVPRPPGLDAPLLVVVDQEGGPVRRIPNPALPSAADLGRRGDASAARRAGRRAGRDLLSVGGNLDAAPVADVARPGSAIGRERRSFGGSPDDVARMARAFHRGLRDVGVAAAAKHFPGFGAAPANTDFGAVRIPLAADTLRALDMRPFAALVDDGVPAVMVGSSVYAAFGPRPAVLTRSLVTGELRGRLGFTGVTVSDALDTPALAAAGTPDAVALDAAVAGVDLLLYASSRASAEGAADAIRRGIASGRIPRSEAEDAAARVLALRAALPAPPG